MWCDLMWFDVIWFDLIWFDLIWFDVMWCDLMWFDVIWCDLMWFDVIWFDLILQVSILQINKFFFSFLEYFNSIQLNYLWSYKTRLNNQQLLRTLPKWDGNSVYVDSDSSCDCHHHCVHRAVGPCLCTCLW
uniref:Uncharacterized protein n=1 Tax=Austropuccinia psidii TaxID=181123 RepID=A0A513X020_9BASI|nr:hypothetical protein [Austropuccinia psidii]QDH07277.1 hypothetical protein [Austropuccinia psidii]